MFDGNWCKLAFLLFGTCQLVLLILVYLFEPYLPDFAPRLGRYGKLLDQSPRLRLPKSYFRHFYVLASFVYAPVALYQVISVYIFNSVVPEWFITILNICCGSRRHVTATTAHTVVAVLLLTVQTWRRFYDTHFVSVFSKNASINLFHYVIGLFYYMGAFLIVLGEAPKFANMSDTSNLNLTDLTLVDALAVVIFVWAWYHQHTTTKILAHLRRNKKGVVVTESYKIPHGDLFQYLSSPHCLMEIIMYTCIWVVLGFRHSWWCVSLLVFVNQVDSIIASHKWYQTKFKDFPTKRKAFIPFII